MNLEKLKTESGQAFDPNRSELETNPEKAKKYVQLLASELGHGFVVDGIIQMGSYAKGEAVPGSDVDTRVYVSSPDFYLRQTSGSRLSDARQKETEQKFADFLKTADQKPCLTIDWNDFNDPVAKKICAQLSVNVEFGLADSRFAEYELAHIDTQPTPEHQLLLESNLVYDPKNWLAKRKTEMDGIIYPALVALYQDRYLNALPFEIYTHLQPHEGDARKLEKSRQIQWLKWAVRSIRDAVGAKTYQQTGRLVYKKADVLNFCSATLSPEDVAIIKELYHWKTDPQTREQMVNDFLANPKKYFALFAEKTKVLEDVVKRIKDAAQ